VQQWVDDISRSIAINLKTLLISIISVTTIIVATDQIVSVAIVIYPYITTVTFSSSEQHSHRLSPL
jgi:hypothetical protein